MGLKQFNQDVAQAKDITIVGVSNIRRGDSDGELVFTYSHDKLASDLDIQVLNLDTESYPKSPDFIIFTSSDNGRADILTFLQRLAPSLSKQNVQSLVSIISKKLTAKLEVGCLESSEQDSELSDAADVPDDSYSEEDSFGDEDEDEDEYILSDRGISTAQRAASPSPLDLFSTQRLKKDLRAAVSIGASVGIFPEGRLEQADIISLSLRAANLGIPEDFLEAWDIKSNDYLIILCRFPGGYPSISDLMSLPPDQIGTRFRFGKCGKAKPSLMTAKCAFDLSADDSRSANEAPRVDNGQMGYATSDFLPLYVSNSINLLLNNEFFQLLKLRRNSPYSWDAAQTRLFQLSRGENFSSKVSQVTQGYDASDGNRDPPVSSNAHISLNHDYAMDEDKEFNLLMTSLQFALRRLARCTQYCMVCHQRMELEFEALKPYVCSNNLCLYQYINLGLGSSIEHEIIKNPFVVDLLICFFYSAVAAQTSVREYPTGLNLKGILTGSKTKPEERLVGEACFAENLIKFDPADYTSIKNLKEGATILVVIDGKERYQSNSISNGFMERHLCRITSMQASSCNFEIMSTDTAPLNVAPDETPTQGSEPTYDWQRVWVYQFANDLDKFDEEERRLSLSYIMRGIPSVLKIREFLLQNPGRRLSSWERMDKNGLMLLHWIIVSNRSLILQDEPVPTMKPETSSNDKISTSGFNKVQGIPPGYMQFRFLQGTPERERLFVNELRSNARALLPKQEPPTIFAWHGSALNNWHSIIRTGLDFKTTANGRSYGHGVYFSPFLSTSASYSSGGITRAEWPNSQLSPQSALGICELINRTNEFVSTKPHYVVNKLEWIQCRYLVVMVRPTLEAISYPFQGQQTRNCTGYVPQCMAFQLNGIGGERVEIPLSALSATQRRDMNLLGKEDTTIAKTITASSATKAPGEEPQLFLESGDDETDYAFLMDSGDEFDIISDFRKRRRSPSQDILSQASSKLSSKAHGLKMRMEDVPLVTATKVATDFQPGSLDLGSLPKLPEPAWATSSPGALQNLARAVKELQQIQSTSDIGSLGWYIDFNVLTNMFHWIVELHTFDKDLPLAKDMKKAGCTSVVLEMRFGGNYPFSPPFVRVIRPRFRTFMAGGGGHVTSGGSICSEMLTNSGWSPALSVEKVLLQVRLGLCDLDPPARLETGYLADRDYGIGEAISAYTRAAASHDWQVPEDIRTVGAISWSN